MFTENVKSTFGSNAFERINKSQQIKRTSNIRIYRISHISNVIANGEEKHTSNHLLSYTSYDKYVWCWMHIRSKPVFAMLWFEFTISQLEFIFISMLFFIAFFVNLFRTQFSCGIFFRRISSFQSKLLYSMHR